MPSKKPEAVIEDGTVYILRAGTPVYVKTADICAMTGKSNQWIGQLVSQGTLHKRSTPHGSLFDLAATMRAYCAMLEARGEPEPSEQERRWSEEKNTADVMLKTAKAQIAQMEADELCGKMHRSEDVAAMTEDLIYTIRGSLMALPGRLAVDVTEATAPAEAAEIIRREVYQVMQELSRYQYDPRKYQERVRERRKWSSQATDEDSISGGL